MNDFMFCIFSLPALALNGITANLWGFFVAFVDKFLLFIALSMQKHQHISSSPELKMYLSVCTVCTLYFWMHLGNYLTKKRKKSCSCSHSAWYRLSAESLKFPLTSPRVWGPCEMVPMCCRALTEWNMSAQCHRLQASCLVISLPCSTGTALCIGGISVFLDLGHSHRYG